MNFADLFKRAFDARSDLFSPGDTDSFRLFNSSGDGFEGLAADIYGRYILVQLFEGRLFEIRNDIVDGLIRASAALPVSPEGFLLKDRTIQRGDLDYGDIRRSVLVEGHEPPPDYSVKQNGVSAYVDLVEGQSTGIFLDMREIRRDIAPLYPAGGSILNLFSYTGLFSVHALKNGMNRSLNVDLSKAVLQKAAANYRLNGLKFDDRDFIYGDALQWMKRLQKRGEVFSLVVFDPPTFSRNRKNTFSVKHDYPRALEAAAGLCDRYVFTAVNSRSVSENEYLSYHPGSWKLAYFGNESADFRGQERYLKAGLWELRR